jgi:hypothetical protein
MELVGIGREIILSQTMDQKGTIKRSASGSFIVRLAADGSDDWIDAPNCSGIPPFGDIYTGFTPNLWLSKKNPKRTKDSKFLIEVEVEYTDVPQAETSGNPASWNPIWLGSSVEKLPMVAYKDFDGADIRLTNGQLYSDPVQYAINILVTKYRKYCPITSADAILLAHNGRINSAVYRGDPKWWWQCTVSATPTTVNDYPVAELQYELRRNPLTWVEERLQHDAVYLDSSKLVMFRTAAPDNAPTTGDLDNSGNKLGAGAAKIYKQYRVNGELNFSVLGF